jgi:hypothetical protein
MTRRELVQAAIAVTLTTGSAHALPKVGDARPNVVLKDAWDRTLDLSQVGGRPLLLVYEDKESSSQNQAFKNELSRLAKGPRASRIVLAAIADVQGYDYWPARGFVKDAIRSQSSAIGAPIYCDWSGSMRSTLGLRRGRSTIILYDAAGHVAFAYEGAMDEAARARAISLVNAAVGG